MLLKRQLLYQGCFKYIKAYKLVWVLSYPDSPRQRLAPKNGKRNKNCTETHSCWAHGWKEGKGREWGSGWLSCCSICAKRRELHVGHGNKSLGINQGPSHSISWWQNLYHLQALFLCILPSPPQKKTHLPLCPTSKARYMVPLLLPSFILTTLWDGSITLPLPNPG